MKWLSRLPVTEEIAGSNPVERAMKLLKKDPYGSFFFMYTKNTHKKEMTVMPSSVLHYAELTQEEITPQIISNLNHLQPQLTSKPLPLTHEYLDHLFKSGTRLFAAFDAERVVGVALLCKVVMLVGQKDWIEDVVVDSEYRRLGIASHLLDMIEEASRSCKPERQLNLTSKTTRNDALKMYGDRGYKIQDVVVLRKTF
ncbi:MAG: acetyltransferase family [Candidatus Saccharibacteria bacterium]|nr:acetyltransferase family [Candidatus Saccharibacteria bacterium]